MKKTASRFLALLTVGALSVTALLQAAPAHADKAKNYKYGAIGLGVLGGVLLSKGNTVAGAAALGAGAYAYKKGEDTRKAEKYDRYDYGNRYGYNYGDRSEDRYGNSNGQRYNDRYGSNASVYPDANAPYNSGYDSRSNGNDTYRARRDRDDSYRSDRNGRDDLRLR